MMRRMTDASVLEDPSRIDLRYPTLSFGSYALFNIFGQQESGGRSYCIYQRYKAPEHGNHKVGS